VIGVWIAAAVVTVAVLALLVLPLVRRGATPPDRLDYDRAIWRDQLAEIERDVARGVLAGDQAEAARLEIKRRILATSSAPGETGSVARAGSPLLALALIALVPALAVGLYATLGRPGVEDQPLAARLTAPPPGPAAAGEAPQMSLEEAAERLRARLDERPAELDGWVLLGRSYMTLNRPADAAAAFARALDLAGDRPDLAASYGEALVAARGGRMDADARAAFAKALAGDARDPRARYYLGLARAQDGDLAGALQDWVDLVAIAPAEAPWLPMVREQIASAAAEAGIDPATLTPSAAVADLMPAAPVPGLSREDVEGARQMSPAEREAMVRSMVEGLAARLEEQPDDIEGWRRLARAWTVLGEPAKAAEAEARIKALQAR
jgi:cytochrome c-type biogenesis protein CcmH